MLAKSSNSYEAGDRLLTQGYYSQCVHSFYYSVLQKMKYCLAHCKQNQLSYEDQDYKANLNNKSTHDWLISEVVPRMSSRRSREAFSDDIFFLKQERVDADYTNRVFSQENSVDCKEAARRLLSKLDTII